MTAFFTHDDLYLCIDQGGQSSRAIVFDHQGQVVAKAHQPLTAHRPGPDKVEYEPLGLLDSITQSIDDVLQQLGSRANNIKAAGLATQRSNVACWDTETGHALGPVLSWQDRRMHEWLQSLQQHAESVHKKTGLFMSAHCGASKLRWYLDHIPRIDKIQQENHLAMGPMASFIIYNLLEERPLLTDPVNASRTQLLNIKNSQWDSDLIELFGLPASSLPQCVPNLFDYGRMHIAEKHIPLRLLTGDQSAAMYAYGRVQPDTAYINIGTGAFVSRPLGPVRVLSPHLLTSIILQKNKQREYVLEGTVNGGASAIKWFAHETGVKDIFDSLPAWLNEAKEVPLFLNGISGLGSPYWIADFPCRFIGEGTLQEQAVAVVESIVFLLNENLEAMRHLSSPPEQIQITGGISQIDGICQRLADISQLPVYRPADCEATARGSAFLLAGCPEYWPEAEAGTWFEPQSNMALNKRYVEWRKEMKTAVSTK
ncbi:MAG: FGGY family carbohydrate kinase [Gammaproteobacteria bacterium]|nr:FGGY family carbohydrate kinase [Gammaproteobacteria bacterium]